MSAPRGKAERAFAEVLKSGPLTLVQDGGRPGFVSAGVPFGGAMDPFALNAANLALGNAPDAPVLEATLNRLELRILSPLRLCVGGFPAVRLGERELRPLEPFEAEPGEVLKLSPREGARGYLACEGGLAVRAVLGSASTYLPAGLGGYQGRALRAGDRLQARSNGPSSKKRSKARRLAKAAATYLAKQDRLCLRFVAEAPEGGHALASREWRVDPRSDRVGVRLQASARLDWTPPGGILSQGAFFGLIQFPPDGNPILLGADAQTIGGYAIAGAVVFCDLWKIGQLLPGETLRFASVNRAQAATLWREQRKALD